ncbi:MAG: ribosomal RNA small subunit methyltransferase A [Proteobacteria bacterium]|nr:ribosomal RNA small subunit methyltransferase A [Pseudomonadota bacterium]
MKKKKHFGQHFLCNPGIIEKIVMSLKRLDHEQIKTCLEIGPGDGALTGALLKEGFKVSVVEIDDDMVKTLNEKFSSEVSQGKLEIIPGDFLEINSSQFLHQKWSFACGNLPYNCGTEIVFKFLEDYPNIQRFGFMLQREVVEKFISKPEDGKRYGVPSVKFGLSCKEHDHFWIQAGSFNPPPKVESGFFVYSRQDKALADPLIRNADYDKVSEWIEKSFQQRRKKLRNSLGLKSSEWSDKRPEELSPADFIKLLKGA